MSSPKGKSVINDMTDLIVPAALRIWLVFLLMFALLGYSVTASILFGAMGGFAGGVVAAWWHAPGGEPKPKDDKQNQQKVARLFQLPSLRFRAERRRLRRRQR
ncbi:MAG: hypothetical protein F6K11_04115 [Leptolyngbya sp. SIO3F4]|nr:hypothetical protein [Leptolyngbya sp. SIO3F4]